MDVSIHPGASAASPQPELARWHHVALPVSDLARSVEWYRRVLFASVQRTTDSAAELAAGRIPQAWLDIAGITVNLAQHHPLAADPERHFLHIALVAEPADLQVWMDHLATNGVQPLGPYGHGGLAFLSVYFDDPDGFRWELIVEHASFEAALAQMRAFGGEIGSPVKTYEWEG